MLNFLIRSFIKNHGETGDVSVRAAYGKLAGWIGIVCNAMLFLGKGLAGVLSGSLSIMADAVNNLSDAASSVISLLGFKLAGRPADEGHPYGHGRYEYFAGLMVSALIIVIGVEFMRSSIGKIIRPEPVELSLLSVCILAGSIFLKLWMMLMNRSLGKKIRSQTLIATAADSRNDVITTLAVLAAAVISHFTGFELDGPIGLAVAVFILVSGVRLIGETIDPILGRAPDADTVRAIRAKITGYPGVLGTHDLLIHDYGPGRQFASVHVEMAAEADVIDSHDVIDTIEQDFMAEEGLHIIVHYDPIITGDGVTGDLRAWLDAEVRIINPGFSIHDLRIVPGATQKKLVFDCSVPIATAMTDGEIRAAVGALVRKTHPEYGCSVVIDRNYAAIPRELQMAAPPPFPEEAPGTDNQ